MEGNSAIKQKLFLQNKEWFICQSRHSTPKNWLRKSEESYAYTILPILGISLKIYFCSGLFWLTQLETLLCRPWVSARQGQPAATSHFLHSESFNLKVHDLSKQLCNQGRSGGAAFSQILLELKCLLGCSLSRQLVAFYICFPWQLCLIYFHCN